MRTYTQFKYWSIVEGGNVLRISMRNDQRDELFVIVPVAATSGRALRQARERGLDALSVAIDSECPPGQVFLNGEG
jgi:hypothetical protein